MRFLRCIRCNRVDICDIAYTEEKAKFANKIYSVVRTFGGGEPDIVRVAVTAAFAETVLVGTMIVGELLILAGDGVVQVEGVVSGIQENSVIKLPK